MYMNKVVIQIMWNSYFMNLRREDEAYVNCSGDLKGPRTLGWEPGLCGTAVYFLIATEATTTSWGT